MNSHHEVRSSHSCGRRSRSGVAECRRPLMLLLLALSATPAPADTFVSNLTNIADGTYNVFDLDNFGNRFARDVANSFTTGAAATTLESVTVFMGNSSANNGGFSLSLYSNAGGIPGANLNLPFAGSLQPTDGLFTYATCPFILEPNTTYWVVASVAHAAPDKQYAWRTTSDGTAAAAAGWDIGATVLRPVSNGNPGSWGFDANSTQIFSIQASPFATAVAADFEEDGTVDGGDLALWRTHFGTLSAAAHGQGDADADGDVDGGDVLVWQRQFCLVATTATAAAIPEPTAGLLTTMACFGGVAFGRARRVRRAIR